MLSLVLPGLGLLPRVGLSPGVEVFEPHYVGNGGAVSEHKIINSFKKFIFE